MREERVEERALHGLAKAIHFEMKAGKLDDVTHKTFKWMKNRLTAAEKEQLERDKNGDQDVPAEQKPLNIVERDKRADKGRIRRIKEKVIRIIAQPRS